MYLEAENWRHHRQFWCTPSRLSKLSLILLAITMLDPTSTENTVINPSVLSSNSPRARSQITLQDLKNILQEDPNIKRVTVEQIQRVKLMHDKFHQGARWNFNYATLLIVASVIAGLGLVSDNTATVIASMLGESWCVLCRSAKEQNDLCRISLLELFISISNYGTCGSSGLRNYHPW